jgi:hypothetical protein
MIFLSHQTEYAASSVALREAFSDALETLNQRSRLPLTLIESHRPTGAPIRLGSTSLRKIRKSLLFVADGTPVARIPGNETQEATLIPSPNVCVEMGYALQSKRSEQILLVQMERKDLPGQFPFDLPARQQLLFKSAAELDKMLPTVLESLLQRFNLFS